MDTMTYEECLVSMGYRKLNKSNVWAKPVGHTLFVYIPEFNEWKVIAQSMQGEPLIWDSHMLSTEAEFFLSSLKNFEREAALNIGSYDSVFEFMSTEEFLNLKL